MGSLIRRLIALSATKQEVSVIRTSYNKIFKLFTSNNGGAL